MKLSFAGAWLDQRESSALVNAKAGDQVELRLVCVVQSAAVELVDVTRIGSTVFPQVSITDRELHLVPVVVEEVSE